MLEIIRNVVFVLLIADIFVGLGCGIVLKRHRAEAEEWLLNSQGRPPWYATGVVLSVVMYPLLVLADLVLDLIAHDWAGAAFNAGFLLWVWWHFFDGNGRWKRLRKRLKERVAVIKGRLKVVPIVSPMPA